MQEYKDEYSKQYSCIVKSSKSDEHAFCTICSADISISYILPYFGVLSPFFTLCRLASLCTVSAVIIESQHAAYKQTVCSYKPVVLAFDFGCAFFVCFP